MLEERQLKRDPISGTYYTVPIDEPEPINEPVKEPTPSGKTKKK